MHFTLFESTFKPVPVEQCTVTWLELIEHLRAFQEIPHAKKDDAPLWNTVEYKQKRCRAHAICSDTIILDVDSGATFDDFEEHAAKIGIEALMYTSGSHLKDGSTHKFRFIVPLKAPVLAADYAKTWDSVDAFFFSQSDDTKHDTDAHFYVPGKYSGSEERFAHIEGAILTAADWRELKPVYRPRQKNRRPKTMLQQQKEEQNKIKRQKRAASGAFKDKDIPLLSDAAADKYFSASSESRYHARYGLFMSIVGRAQISNQYVSAADLVNIYNDLDCRHPEGPRHQGADKQKTLWRDAIRAASKL